MLVRLFGAHSPFAPIKEALLSARLELAVSTETLLEYEEVIGRLSSPARWQQVAGLLENLSELHVNVVSVTPSFRFHVISSDPDDNAFVDCAIAAQADFVITSDADFGPLRYAGYKPVPLTPEELVLRLQPL